MITERYTSSYHIQKNEAWDSKGNLTRMKPTEIIVSLRIRNISARKNWEQGLGSGDYYIKV